MSACAVILAGGKGTRSADPGKPKLAQEIGGRSLLQWHLDLIQESQIKEVIIVAGHLGSEVQQLANVVDAGSLNLHVLQEPEQRGTVAATRFAAEQTDQEELLVILGDIWMALPIDQFVIQSRASKARVGVVVHPSSHPEDSDAVFADHLAKVHVIPKADSGRGLPNSSSAGLFAMSQSALEAYGSATDIGSDLLPLAASRGDLFVFVTSHYLKDTGTPERLESARRDYSTGAFERRGNRQPRPALFLDRDGVVNPAKPDYFSADHYELLPGIAQAIREANLRGIPVIVVTNQPHIAKGFMTFEDHQGVRARMDALLAAEGAFVDDYLFCPHHPESGFEGEIEELKVMCECRKPGTAMAVEAAIRHNLDLTSSVLVGDTERDQGLAAGAKMSFIDVANQARSGSQASPSLAIAEAVTILSC